MSEPKPSVSLVLAGLDEAAIVAQNLETLCRHMAGLAGEYEWEIVFVNDGSGDDTGAIAEAFAAGRDNVRVLHHHRNFGLGQALRHAFPHCRGDYLVVLDIDLSYGPEHIEPLLTAMRERHAKIVATSPYMPGGRISNVPWFRKALTIGSNWFLSKLARGNLSSLTPMVRAYDRRFLSTLDLRSTGMDINLEILYKALMLNATVEEIPAHLDWSLQRAQGAARQSKMKVARHTVAVLVSGFLFRPVLFFVVPGIVVGLMSAYANFWLLVHVVQQYGRLPPAPFSMHRVDAAVAAAFDVAPHAFVVGGLTLVLAIQLLGLGVLALQSTNYFEQVFHLGTTILKRQQGTDDR